MAGRKYIADNRGACIHAGPQRINTSSGSQPPAVEPKQRTNFVEKKTLGKTSGLRVLPFSKVQIFSGDDRRMTHGPSTSSEGDQGVYVMITKKLKK